jgi:hypothetical protein
MHGSNIKFLLESRLLSLFPIQAISYQLIDSQMSVLGSMTRTGKTELTLISPFYILVDSMAILFHTWNICYTHS